MGEHSLVSEKARPGNESVAGSALINTKGASVNMKLLNYKSEAPRRRKASSFIPPVPGPVLPLKLMHLDCIEPSFQQARALPAINDCGLNVPVASSASMQVFACSEDRGNRSGPCLSKCVFQLRRDHGASPSVHRSVCVRQSHSFGRG